MLQNFSKFHQKGFWENSPAYTTQNSPSVDKPLLLNTIVLERNVKILQPSDELKPFLPKSITNRRKSQISLHKLEKLFIHMKIIWSRIILKNLCFFFLCNHTMNKISRKNRDTDKLDLIQNALITSYINSEIDGNVFDDDFFCSNNDKNSIMYDDDYTNMWI